MGGSFGMTVLLVGLLWLGTPVLVAIVDSLGLFGRQDPESGAMQVNGVLLATFLLYAIYVFVGAIAGLTLLFINRRIGAGILAGTGLGAVAGFLTCLAIL